MSSRRDFMKWSLVTGGATLAGLGLLKFAHAQEVCLPLPPPPPPGTDPMPLAEGLQGMPGEGVRPRRPGRCRSRSRRSYNKS